MPGAPLVLYNSLTRSAETFVPIDPADVRIYSCGPTVYHYAHIGNLRAYVFTDTLSRVLAAKFMPPRHIINITDVGHLTGDDDAGDDKMEARARETGQDIWAISRQYTDAFKRNLADLNVRAPSDFPLATDHVDEMIAFAEVIEANGYAYRLSEEDAPGAAGLYFDVGKLGPAYGRLARSETEAAMSWVTEGRIDLVETKERAADFALWRTTPPGENRLMEWPSPWGRGAPGWHLECSVMSKKYLGERFDIHTGGIDHREIHHPNEIAQNQAHCRCDDTGATFWMHNNFLVERARNDGGKMSKSSGSFTTLSSLVDAGFHPLSYRLMCLQAHYRSELEFSGEGLAAAQTRLKRLIQAVETVRATPDAVAGERRNEYRAQFDEAVSNDLNTPPALVVLERMITDKTLSSSDKLTMLAEFDAVLGLNLTALTREALRVRPAAATIDDAAIAARLDERRTARAARDFPRSDAIRDELAAAGVEVMDGDPLGWDWAPVHGSDRATAGRGHR